MRVSTITGKYFEDAGYLTVKLNRAAADKLVEVIYAHGYRPGDHSLGDTAKKLQIALGELKEGC